MAYISDVVSYSEENLINNLRLVGLKGRPQIKPYSRAFISVEELDPTALAPAQNYVLVNELNKIRDLYFNLHNDRRIDIFKLNGWVKVIYSDEEEVGILSPVVEESIIDAKPYYIIADGLHRIYTAYLMHKRINVALIRGVDQTFPYYALPRRNPDWNSIEIRNDLPANYIKKTYITDQHKLLFRDFTPIFQNKSTGRGFFTKGE